MNSELDLVNNVATMLRGFAGLNVVTVEHDAIRHGRRCDGVIEIRSSERAFELIVETKRSSFPRDIRSVIDRFATLRDVPGVIPLFAAPSISIRNRVTLREAQIGYWDLSDSLYLWTTHGLVIWIENPPRAQPDRKVRNLFRGSAAQVVQTLLIAPERRWHIGELAEQAHVAASTAHHVCTTLEAKRFLDKEGNGPAAVRSLPDPSPLLDAWAATSSLDHYQIRRYHHWSAQIEDTTTCITDAFARSDVAYALTLTSGARRRAPFVWGDNRISLIVADGDQADRCVRDCGGVPVDNGENIVLLVTGERSPLAHRKRVDHLWIASDIQLYLDLVAAPGRGKEQAAHLRQERIGF